MRRLSLRFVGPEPGQVAVPAQELAHALEGLQRVVQLLGLQHEGGEVRQRARLGRGAEQKYVLSVGPSQRGSLVVPLEVGDPAASLTASEDIDCVTGLLQETLAALEAGSLAAFRNVVPDEGLRARILDSARKMLPRSGRGYSMEIRGRDDRPLATSERLSESIQRLQVGSETRQELTTVTGVLDEINFGKRALTILYPPTRRALECTYDPDVEELLLQNPRDLIQITGRVVLDESASPVRIYDVIDIVEVDLSPILLTDVLAPEGILHFHEPLALVPEMDESQQGMAVSDSELGIDAYSATRADLIRELHGNVRFLWRTYATAEDSTLSGAAARRKRNLVKRITVLHRAEE